MIYRQDAKVAKIKEAVEFKLGVLGVLAVQEDLISFLKPCEREKL